MKDKRLDALLDTLFEVILLTSPKCWYYDTHKKGQTLCKMAEAEHGWEFHTSCQGDIRQCEREE